MRQPSRGEGIHISAIIIKQQVPFAMFALGEREEWVTQSQQQQQSMRINRKEHPLSSLPSLAEDDLSLQNLEER
jgi:hypothetical protein